MNKKKSRTVAITLLSAIAVLLVLIVALIPDRDDPDAVSEAEDYAISSEDNKEKPVPVPEKPSAKKKEIYIVIDDVGNSLQHLESFLSIPVKISFAIMPGRPHSEESSRRIRKAGFDAILHQPMEAEGGQNPGVGAIMVDMDKDEIYRVFDENLRVFPWISGINNHMGSKATADVDVMKSVMSYLKSKGMFFLDSVTTNHSVAGTAAGEQGVPYARRNAIFLDNEGDREHVEKAFRSGVDVAGKQGQAIMIGHVKTEALAEVITDAFSSLIDEGYTFLGVSHLFTSGGDG